MAARTMWTGNLKLGSSGGIPVKLYSAIQDRAIRFHVLDAKTRSRVKQHMVTPDSGDEVPSGEIRKGFEVEPGTFVALDEEELSKLEPKASRDIEIMRFVPSGHISHVWYDRPYYLGPGGDSGKYFAFVSALEKESKEGVVRWIMRKKAYVGALRTSGDYLTLITLKHADEVVPEGSLPAPKARDLSDKELKMAGELVRALEGEFNPEDYRDEYRDRVLKFVEAKARGKKPRLGSVRRKKTTESLAKDLARSLSSLKRGSHDKERKIA
jgi:DNA end-binding protein Ku